MKPSILQKTGLILAVIGVAATAHATPPPSNGASGKTANTADQLNKKELTKIHNGPGRQAKVTTPKN